MAKPVGAACNLACPYCFYLEKGTLLGHGQAAMPDEVLEAYIRAYIAADPAPETEFVWHGGEPLLCGIPFFEKAIRLQKKHARGKKILNTLQTNGTLIDDAWCRFLKAHAFSAGLSLDGPKAIHDRYRTHADGSGSFDEAMRAFLLLKKHGVPVNILACVTRQSCETPLEIYRFFKETGAEFIQFTPLVERLPGAGEAARGQRLAGFPSEETPVTGFSVIPEAYGDFLIAVFDEWIRHDVGSIFINTFEAALAQWVGNPSPACTHARQCGRCLIVERDGAVYACDHAAYPEYRLGSVLTDSLAAMAASPIARALGEGKEKNLTAQCRACPWLQLCFGGCPKQRFGAGGQHYLCPGYAKFFAHIPRYMHAMETLLLNGYPPALVMDAIDKPLFLGGK